MIPIFTKESTLELANLSIATDGDVRTYLCMLNLFSPSNFLQHSIRERERDRLAKRDRERERERGREREREREREKEKNISLSQSNFRIY